MDVVMLPPGALNLDAVASENYLGDPAVVRGLVGEFVAGVATLPTRDAVVSLIHRMAGIFSGVDRAYTPIEGWNARAKLGYALATRYQVSPDQPMMEIVGSAFGRVAVDLRTLLFREPPPADEEWQFKMRAEIDHLSSVLLGLAEQTHPLLLDPPPPEPEIVASTE